MSRRDKNSKPVISRARRLVIVRLTIAEAEAYEFAADQSLDDEDWLKNLGVPGRFDTDRKVESAQRAAEKIRAAIREAKGTRDRRNGRQSRYEDGTK